VEQWLSYITQGLALGLIYGIVALGFVLIYKSSRILNFAVGEFLLAGAFVAWTARVVWGLPVWLCFAVAIVVAVILGLMIERVAIRPLIGQPLLGVIMMTLAIMVILRGFVLLIWGAIAKTYEPRLFPGTPIILGDLVIRQEYVWGFLVAVIMLGIFTYFFRFTKAGLAMRATSEDHQLARGTGIRVKTVFAQSWAICAVVAGIAGIILASMTNVTIDLANVGLKSIAVVLVGGLESVPGAIIAGLIIGVSEQLLGVGLIDPYVGGGSAEVFAFAIAIVVLLVWPYGLFGLRRIERI
jgi:branched-chain amino acid transport system permease protein